MTPSADAMALAFRDAAIHTREIEALTATPLLVFGGYRPFRARWLVLYALLCAGVVWPRAKALCHIEYPFEREDLRIFMLAPWWSWEVAQTLTAQIAAGSR